MKIVNFFTSKSLRLHEFNLFARSINWSSARSRYHTLFVLHRLELQKSTSRGDAISITKMMSANVYLEMIFEKSNKKNLVHCDAILQ